MQLQERVESDYNALFTNKQPTEQQKAEKSLLQQIIAEFQRRPNLKKPLTDIEVIAIITKYVKNNNELLKFVGENAEKVAKIKSENEFLSKNYLPEQASYRLLFLTTLDLIEDNPNTGKLMGLVIGKCKAKNLAVDTAELKAIIETINNMLTKSTVGEIKKTIETFEKYNLYKYCV